MSKDEKPVTVTALYKKDRKKAKVMERLLNHQFKKDKGKIEKIFKEILLESIM